MSSKYRNAFRAVAVLTVFCVAQVYVLGKPGAPATGTESTTDPRPQSPGTIKTTDNKPITVNGNSVRPGTSILPGSSVATPDGVGATLEMVAGRLDISPNSELTVDFSDVNVKVTLKSGCVILTVLGNATGVVITPDGTTIEVEKGKSADVCVSRTGAPIVNQGAAANAGAGAGGGTAGTGINRTLLAVLLIGGGVAVAAILVGGGNNPSPSTP